MILAFSEENTLFCISLETFYSILSSLTNHSFTATEKSISPMVFPKLAQNLLVLDIDSTPLVGPPAGALQEKCFITLYPT